MLRFVLCRFETVRFELNNMVRLRSFGPLAPPLPPPGLRLRGLLPQVLGRLHAGRVVGREEHREAGTHAGPAGARHLGGPGRLREC